MKKLVVVLGMHRSGTSLVTQICQCMGGYLGEKDELMNAAKDNMDGFFENKKITYLDDRIINLCNREWFSLEPLQLDYLNPKIIEMAKDLRSTILNLFKRKSIVVVKDPRIAILLPLWEKVIKDLKIDVEYIWVYRNPFEVAESLRKRDGFSQEHSLLLWTYHNLRILEFLQGKRYLLIDYKEILDNDDNVFDRFSDLFDRVVDDALKEKLSSIVKYQYRHSNISHQSIHDLDDSLISEIYYFLAERKKEAERISIWKKWYAKRIKTIEECYLDYEILKDVKYLSDKYLIIYGAGEYGKKALKMLRQLGYLNICFCDRDFDKYGTKLMGADVFSIKDIEEKKDILFIIALSDPKQRKEAEQTLACIKDARFLSFFALSKIWKYTVNDSRDIVNKIEAFSLWHRRMSERLDIIKAVFNGPQVWVYQNGKVGSSSVSKSLQYVGIENLHVHRLFFKNDILKSLILGPDEVKGRNGLYCDQSQKYLSYLREEVKHKKIITLVRDPIAVDLSTVFQWFGEEDADRYFAEQMAKKVSFLQSVTQLMERIQNRLFDWFDEELYQLCGINVFDYPFDRKKGYTIIKENGTEILLLKMEKMSQATNMIKEFICNDRFEVVNENIGYEKEYSHIYRSVKKDLVLTDKYIDFYYDGNAKVDHFYSENEKNYMRDKWKK